PLLLTDKNSRQKLVTSVKKSEVLRFWQRYELLRPDEQEDRFSPTLRRVEEFLQRLTNNIVGQSNSTIDFRAIMDESKILLVKLDSLRLSSITNLIGSLFIAAFLTAASTRMRKQNIFNIYADEFQNFATEDFVKLIEEARKFGIGITIAHQNRAQLELSNKQSEIELKKRVLNVGSLIVFCVPTDAQELAGQFDTTPPPAETHSEYVRTPTHKPIDFIVSGKSHPNEVVNTVFGEWKGFVERANEPIRDLRIPAGTWRGRQEYNFVSNEPIIRQAQYEMQTINDLFYQVMLEKNPHQVVPIALVYWMAKTFGLPFFDYNRYSQLQEYLYEKKIHEIRWGETIYCEKRFCQGDCGKEAHCDFAEYLIGRHNGKPQYIHVLPCYKLANFYPLRDYFAFLLDTVAWGEERKPTEEDIKLYVMLWLAEDDQIDSVLSL
ncbi:MAG TPA: type IV secretory system conjugative DNA transfer family protein, partial [Methylomirabilota bacterium]|nr:type IV secretory system conjugative DNA transfer family protein [Methylomirabilota bacterium]